MRKDVYMDYIKFNFKDKIIKGIPLAKFKTKHPNIIKRCIPKKFLFIKYNKIIKEKNYPTLYIVFIPWKHEEKELKLIEETNIIDLKEIKNDKWIHVKEYRSKSYYDAIGYDCCDVSNFYGLDFIYQNNQFVVNMIASNYYENLTILYKEMPEILEEEIIWLIK